MAPIMYKFSLRTALVGPFVLQIVTAVGLVGYLSFRNGQKAVTDLANQLMTLVSDDTDQHLDNYLSIPHQINQINIDAIDTGCVACQKLPVTGVLGIDAMLTRVTNLPRDDRWDALARGALRDDLYAVLESLTKSVLDGSRPGSAPKDRIAAWSEANAGSLARAKTALSGIERLDNPGISALSVALRTLRGVIRSGSATV